MKLVTYSFHDQEQVGLIGSDANKIVPVSALGFAAADMCAFIDELQGTDPSALLAQVDAAAAQCMELFGVG